MADAGVTALLKEALALHQAGQLAAAAERYRAVLARAPEQFDALHLLGVVRRQQGDAQEAVRLIGQALAVNPDQATAHCNLGAALQDLGRSGEALASFEAALGRNAGYPLAWSNRGNALRKLGRLPEAVDSYKRALALRPNYAEAWCNRAIALLDLGDARAALESCERALREKRPYPEAACVRANALFQLRAFDAALRGYDEAIALDAQAPEAHTGRGLALLKLGRAQEALAAFESALALRPAHAHSQRQRGDALLALGRRDEAIAAYTRARTLALEAGEDASQLEFALAALGVGTAPERAPEAYVKALFDQYAGHFAQHLTGVLGYRTPALIDAAIRRHVDRGDLVVVDLGCGTGLCAPFLRPLARSLAGVDLSANMLAQARATGLYDELACADIGAWLAPLAGTVDLAVAADVLVYFGDLDALFGAVRHALRPGGWFCCSTEAGEEAGYTLLPSNRYAHTLPYLQRLAAQHGFAVLEAVRAVVRSENGAGIDGYLLVLQAH
ncbi:MULTISPECIES: tetratricopeptide repeat protein [unclassified Massilia]|uniref:tetratricopeptide repeat protein n=1 Tax=unclassified Massilia TaxID=2609279 RepID=UPI00177A9018|nr:MULTISPECIES: tetratricopeptide repeat protein [unclassified Massilia]MBD8530134.1 tetratricopeptide repeat protein [Massilia sp. CFBP 13647]MBD8674037.1 tetratricopeptide repeat protein [Massilia sp. CFBP 13721]